jgi:hypothetical protein
MVELQMAKEASWDERREHVRVVWVSPGVIVLDTGGERPCVVSDLSNGGAKLIELAAEVPDEFMLKLCPKRGPARACRVIWRSKRQAGVEFLEPFPTTMPAGKRAARRQTVDAL